MRRFLFPLAIALTAFIAYVHPFYVLGHLLFDTRLFSPTAIVPTAVVFSGFVIYSRTHVTAPALKVFIHYGLGMGFVAFFVLNTGLLASAVLPGLTREIGWVALAVTVAVCAKGMANGRQLSMRKIEITSPKIKEAVRLVFISDVHLGSNPPRHLENIRSMIKGMEFDALLIGGDLFDSSAFDAGDLGRLKTVKKPILFVTGNHEFYVRDREAKLGELAGHGITLLDGKKTQLKGINIVGIGDNQPVERQLETAHGLLSKEKFNLVMVHRPSLWEVVPDGTDLMLSGHTHNGQIFPFNHLVGLQFKAVYGLYRKGRSTLYVSSGSGCWGPVMRLGTRNEVVSVAIRPKQGD